jgi:hypothetical protein
MKLNYDCLRDVLLALEENLQMSEDLSFDILKLEDITNLLDSKNYSPKDIYYAVYNLIEIDMVEGDIQFADGGIPYFCYIQNITYRGHEFLQTVKSETVWSQIKDKLRPVAGLSVELITEVGKTLIANKLGI